MHVLLGLSIVFASFNSVLLHKAKLKDGKLIYKYNLLCAAVWCVCLFLSNGCKIRFNKDVLLWGIIYGITQTLFILFKTLAMNRGSVSITTLIGNCSLIVSVLVCFFLWKEPISLADICGLAVLMAGIFLTTYKKSKTKQSFAKSWAIYTLFFLVCAAGVGITFKAFSKTSNAENAGDMMLISAIIMLLCYSLIYLFSSNFKTDNSHNKSLDNKEIDNKEKISFIIYALVSGFFSCIYNRLNIYLSGALDAVIFFPVFNGGVVVLSTLLSVLLIREKLSWKQVVGILIGITGICIIGIL